MRATGARCATGSRPSCAPARMATRRSCWCARPIGARRSRPCTPASASASKPRWSASPGGSNGHALPVDRSATERQIGRLLGRNSRAAGRYAIRLVEAPSLPGGFRLEWSVRSEWDEWSRHSEGCYVLRTNVSEWTPEALWRTYIQLSEAEAAFRIHKSELSIRPIWHQRTDRVQAHILVCFLAYVLWKTLEQWQSRAGLGNSPRTILDELGRIQSPDVVLPLAADPSRKLRIRCV